MDGRRFDGIAKGLASGASRRRVIKGLVGGAIGAAAGALGFRRAEAQSFTCRPYGRVCTPSAALPISIVVEPNQGNCCTDDAECRCYRNNHCRCVCPDGMHYEAEDDECKRNESLTTLAASPAAVWAAVTDSSAVAAWMVANDFAPVVGHRFQLRGTPRRGFDGVLQGEVIEVDAPRRAVFTLTGGPLREPATVALSVDADGDGAKLRFTPVGGPRPCAAMMVLLGRDWQEKLLAEGLPRHLDSTRG